MNIEIRYCLMCGGEGEALRVAAELKSRMGLDSTLVDVSKGRFDVAVDNEVIFSKHIIGRFPLAGEIVKIMRNRK